MMNSHLQELIADLNPVSNNIKVRLYSYIAMGFRASFPRQPFLVMCGLLRIL